MQFSPQDFLSVQDNSRSYQGFQEVTGICGKIQDLGKSFKTYYTGYQWWWGGEVGVKVNYSICQIRIQELQKILKLRTLRGKCSEMPKKSFVRFGNQTRAA